MRPTDGRFGADLIPDPDGKLADRARALAANPLAEAGREPR
jgi:hypothetical protein